MILDIIEAVEKRLQDKLPTDNQQILDFKIRKDPSAGYVQPGIYVYVDDGTAQRITDLTDRETVVLNVVVKFKNLKREDERRKGIYPILEGIIGALTRQTLVDGDSNPIGARPLEFTGFRNITLAQENEAGFILFLIQFKIAFTVTKMDDEQVTDLLRMGISYYLQPNNDTPVVTDTLTLQGGQK